MSHNQWLRRLAIELLDDTHGISEPAYKLLREALEEEARLEGYPSANNDILSKVESSEYGRFFMREDEARAIRIDDILNPGRLIPGPSHVEWPGEKVDEE